MNAQSATIEWLEKKISRHILTCTVGSVLSLLAGVIVLFFTFWFTYFVIFIGEGGFSAMSELCFNHKLNLGHFWRLIISGVFILALFIEWMRRSPWDLGKYGKIIAPPGANALARRDGTFALGLLLANPQASSTIIAEILYTGPRLVLGAGSLFRQIFQVRKTDTVEGARILEILAASEKPVIYEELEAAHPDVDWKSAGASMAWISDVIFFEKGLTLTADLREELGEVIKQKSLNCAGNA